MLDTVVKKARISKPNPEYRIRTTNLNSNKLLINYLNKFPLFSSKYFNYLDWIKILTFFENKEYTKKDSINKIIEIKLKMNDRRTEFKWNHLNEFYNLHK